MEVGATRSARKTIERMGEKGGGEHLLGLELSMPSRQDQRTSYTGLGSLLPAD